MNPPIRLKKVISLFLIVLGFIWLGVSSRAHAVSPAPDGGYAGFNTAEGQNALLHLTTGIANTAVGWLSLESNTTNNLNTAIGAGALLANTADQNTATGAGALLSNSTGSGNTADGAFALSGNTTGNVNTANGAFALSSNTTGSQNTANGEGALAHNTTGNSNTASGYGVLYSNTTGGGNTADGAVALSGNTTGADNTASGTLALFSNTTGGNNTAIGYNSLFNNSTGSFNIALQGGFNLTTGNFNIDIGSDGIAGDANTIRIGDGCCQSQTFIAGISGTAISGSAVVVNANGQLGVATSSERFKADIKPMDKASEALFALKPVTFRYKKQVDPASKSQFGLVAEDVEKVNPDLVVRDKEGKPYTVRYDAVNAMLLNEFLKEHKAVVEEHQTVEELKKQVAELAAVLQKMSVQLELNKPAPQTVKNND